MIGFKAVLGISRLLPARTMAAVDIQRRCIREINVVWPYPTTNLPEIILTMFVSLVVCWSVIASQWPGVVEHSRVE